MKIIYFILFSIFSLITFKNIFSANKNLQDNIFKLAHDGCYNYIKSNSANIDFTSLRDSNNNTILHATSLPNHVVDYTNLDTFCNGSLNKPPSEKDRVELALFLINKGIDINSANASSQTPLHLFSSLGYTKVVKILIERGANVNSTDYMGNTPLFYVTRSNKSISEIFFIIDTLIKSGANVNKKNNLGETPIIYLAGSYTKAEKIIKIIEYMLKRNANIRELSNDGKNILHYAVEAGSLEDKLKKFEYLYEKGINIRKKDDFKKTPYHYANWHLQVKIKKYYAKK